MAVPSIVPCPASTADSAASAAPMPTPRYFASAHSRCGLRRERSPLFSVLGSWFSALPLFSVLCSLFSTLVRFLILGSRFSALPLFAGCPLGRAAVLCSLFLLVEVSQ